MASISMTVFLRTRMGIDAVHANYYMGSLFFGLLLLMVIGIPEITLTLSRLPGFYKQREYYLYPAWAYSVPAIILKVPVSLMESFIWTSLTYYVIGYSPEAGRYIRLYIISIDVGVVQEFSQINRYGLSGSFVICSSSFVFIKWLYPCSVS